MIINRQEALFWLLNGLRAGESQVTSFPTFSFTFVAICPHMYMYMCAYMQVHILVDCMLQHAPCASMSRLINRTMPKSDYEQSLLGTCTWKTGTD